MNTEIVSINNTARRDLLNKSGDIRGSRYTFGGVETPAELRNRLKASGLKGNKLSTAVREVRKGAIAVSFAETQAFLEYVRKEGFSPAYADKTSRSATIKLVPLGSEKVKKSTSVETAKAEAREELIAKLIANTGATREQIEATLLA
jgi:hypothetical protein